ncbi:MAG: hypothetical protein H7246_02435 [Phycisphaerae bacterium]|nr:hypothetical protein [Saprospiraceae bacterium]
MSRRYTLRFFAFDHHQSIVPLPLKDGQLTIDSKMPELHVWAEPVRRLLKAKEANNWPENLDWPINNHSSADNAQESIIILFVSAAALTSSSFFEEIIIGKTALRRIEPLRGERSGNRAPNYSPSPIITVSLENAMALYEESAGLDCDLPDSTSWIDKRKENERLYRLGIDHRAKFLDSSIWHRYIAYNSDFEANLLARLHDVVEYSDLRLYRALASLASLEFQCRMLINSFIVPLGANGHHEAVTPFKFHSETRMAEQSERILQFLREQGEEMQLIDLQWNSLIVDDHAVKAISTIDDNLPAPALETDNQSSKRNDSDKGSNTSPPTKRALISRWLNQDKPGKTEKMLNVQTENHTEGDKGLITQSIQILGEQTCDVIFLDYLLGKGETLHANGREYGHEFLLELATRQQKLHRGPLGRYWIFPISSFPFAFADKLNQLGMEGVSDQWYISEGGDPITTPELFRFNFLRMTLLQISECYLYPSAMARLLEGFNYVQDRKEWGSAVRTAFEVKEVNQKLLAFDQKQHSLLARTLRDFLRKQKSYEQQLKDLKVLAIMLERPLNATRYLSIQEQQLKMSEHSEGRNIKKDVILKIVDKKLKDLLSEIYKKHDFAKKKILTTIRKNHAILNLNDQGLLGLPPVIGLCTKVEHLNLSGNRIAILPTELSKLAQLVRLDLSYNDLSKVPLVLNKLPALEWLDLRDNTSLGPFANVYEGSDEIQSLLRMIKEIEAKINVVT